MLQSVDPMSCNLNRHQIHQQQLMSPSQHQQHHIPQQQPPQLPYYAPMHAGAYEPPHSSSSSTTSYSQGYHVPPSPGGHLCFPAPGLTRAQVPLPQPNMYSSLPHHGVPPHNYPMYPYSPYYGGHYPPGFGSTPSIPFQLSSHQNTVYNPECLPYYNPYFVNEQGVVQSVNMPMWFGPRSGRDSKPTGGARRSSSLAPSS